MVWLTRMDRESLTDRVVDVIDLVDRQAVGEEQRIRAKIRMIVFFMVFCHEITQSNRRIYENPPIVYFFLGICFQRPIDTMSPSV